MMYDVPLVPAGFKAFQRSVRFPPLASSVTVKSVGWAGGGAGEGLAGGGIWARL